MPGKNNHQKKVVIITGASSGIGKALAYEYASRDYIVVIAARQEQKLQKIQQEIQHLGLECFVVPTDVSKESDCKRLIEETITKYQRIDILINNAGISMRALFEEMDIAVLEQVMNVNFWGTVYCSKYALAHLQKAQGSLVGVISIAGYMGLPARSAYSASKYAVRGFLDTLRVENLKTGLHVLVAAPGFTASNIRNAALTANGTPQGDSPRKEEKMMSAEEVAKRIANAIKKRKPELILTFLEGKFAVFLKKTFPRYLDRLVFNHMTKESDSPLAKK